MKLRHSHFARGRLLQYVLCHSMALNIYSLYYKYWYLSDNVCHLFVVFNK